MSPVIIDCDPGIDDALALFVACASPEIELEAVTTVAGNRPVEQTSKNAARVLAAAGRGGTPVLRGCGRPLAYPEPRCNRIHGLDGLGGSTLPAGRPLMERHAVEFLASALTEERHDPLVLIAMGPLTNLAALEIQHPGILKRAKCLLVMGGAAFRAGNVTPNAEYNFHADALAAHTVLNSGARIFLFGLDVTMKAAVSEKWLESVRRLGTRCGLAAHQMLRSYAVRDPALHDACPVGYLLAPHLFAGTACRVSVDWQSGTTEGRLHAQPALDAADADGNSVEVFTTVDAEALMSLVRSRIAELP